MKPRRTRLLVTGANGMLGTDMCEIADGRGFPFSADDVVEVSAEKISRFKEIIHITEKRCDLTDAVSVAGLVAEAKPDVIINCAAYTDVDRAETDRERAFAVNCAAVRNVVSVANRCRAKVVHIGTDYSFDGNSDVPYTENDPPSPLGVYAKSKVAGEEEVKKAEHGWLIVRASWLYGAHGKNFVETILRLAAEQPELRVVDDQTGSPTFTRDFAGAVLDLIEKNATGIVHAPNTGSVSWHEFACEILRNAGLANPVKTMTTAELGRPAPRPAFSVLDNTLYSRLTGKVLRGWREALRDFQTNYI